MSWQASAWAQKKGKDYELQPLTRFVLLSMANYADPEGNDIYPSLGTLCADTGLAEATLRRHIKTLLAVGLLDYGDQAAVENNAKIRADKRPKCYRMVFERPGQGRGIDFGNFGTDPDARGLTEPPRTVSGGSESTPSGSRTGSHSETQTINQSKKPESAPAPAAEPLTPEQIEAGRLLRERTAARNAERRARLHKQPTTDGE